MARVQHVLTSKHPKTAKDMELLASLTVAKRDHDPSISLDQPSVSYENILLERFETWKWRDRLVAKSPKITSPCLIAFGPCGLLNFFFCVLLLSYVFLKSHVCYVSSSLWLNDVASYLLGSSTWQALKSG